MMRMHGSITGMRAFAAAAVVTLGLALVATPASAQQPDGRWLPWLGCWEPVDPQSRAALPGDVLVCVRATGGAEAEISTIADGETTTRRVVANGTRRDVTPAGCAGWESAAWSDDGRRVFLRSELDCEGNIQRTQSGVMAWVSPTEWIDAQSVGIGDERAPRVQRFRLVTEERTREAGFEPVSGERAQLASASRTIAAAPLDIEDVREAADRVDHEALQALLIERGEGFELSADRIAALADEGLDEEVIDLMVALSYPGVFRVDQTAMDGEFRPDERRGEHADDPYWRRRDPYGWYDPFDWGYYGRYGSRYCSGWGLGYYGYGYGGCGGYGYGYGYGYNPWGYGYGIPVIIVRDDDSRPNQGGRVIAGRGYTRTNPGNDTRQAKPRGSSGSSSVGASRGSSGGGAASSGSGSGTMTRSGASSGKASGGTARRRGGG
jgi:hypothetical protein